MLKIITFFLFFFLFFSPFLVSAIFITEVQVEGESANDCYIKIYNPSSSDINISGYNLRKKTSSGKDSSIRVFPSGSVITANNYFIWASSRNENFPRSINANAVSTQYLAKNNSIALLNKDKNIIDAVSWGDGNDPYKMKEGLLNPEKGQIIKRMKEKNSDVYINTKNNAHDFTLYPPSPSPSQIKDTITEYGEKDNINPLFIAILSSFLLAFIIIYLNKKWQDTVTQKT